MFGDAAGQTGACVGPCSREAAAGEDHEAAACTALAQQVQHHLWEGSEQLHPALQVLAGKKNCVR